MSIWRRVEMYGRATAKKIRLSTHLRHLSSTSRGEMAEVCRETLASLLPDSLVVPPRSLSRSDSSSFFLLPSDLLPTPPGEAALRALSCAAARGLRVFGRFRQNGENGLKTFRAVPLPSEGERFQGGVFWPCFFLK